MNAQERLKTLEITNYVMSEDTWADIHSTDYKNRISKSIKYILEELYKEKGLWLQNPKCSYVKLGVVINGKWHRLNTLETNSRGLIYLFNLCNKYLLELKNSGILSIKINDVAVPTDKIFITDNWEKEKSLTDLKIKNLLRIIRHKSQEWLTYDSPVCIELMKICYETMLIGDTAEFLCELYLNKINSNITSYVVTEGLGDCNDIDQGTDLWIYNNEVESKYQIKHKYYNVDKDGNVTTYANFSSYSKCDFFVLVYKNNILTVINKNNIRNKKEWFFPKQNITNNFKTIDMFNELKSLMRITGNNDITLLITRNETVNEVNYNQENKTVSINFIDDSDESIKDKINEVIKELEKTFK
jgi:hypothetical protein